MDPPHPLEARARSVLEALERVAGLPEQRRARLQVVDTGSADLWAAAQPDGVIVLDRRALEYCYQTRPQVEGDAVLAFVMGHEVGHLAGDRFLHSTAYFSLFEDPGGEALAESLATTPRDLERDELLADYRGLIYLTMAGFDPEPIVSDSGFFEAWTRQPVSSEAYAHPTPRQRAEFLQQRLGELRRKLPLFHWGTRFYQVGEFELAIAFLTEFKGVFDGAAVLNNLALGHYQRGMQRALQRCPRSALRLRLPRLRIEPRSLADRLVRRGGDEDCLKGDFDLEEAIRLLEIASKQAGAASTARFNLCAVLVAARQGRKAYLCTETLEPRGDRDSQLLEALAVYTASLQSSYMNRAEALNTLRELASNHPESREIAFDHASLVNLDSGLQEALPLWRRFLELEESGAYADLAREHLEVPLPARSGAAGALKAPPAPLGPLGEGGRAFLATLREEPEFSAGGQRWRVYRDARHRVLYRLSPAAGPGRIVIIERKGDNDERDPGEPEHVVPTASGEFRRYRGWGIDVEAGSPPWTVYFEVGR